MEKERLKNNVFLRDASPLVLIRLYKDKLVGKHSYAHSLSKKLDITYSHLFKLIKIFERHNLISGRRVGRTRLLFLTEDGLLLAKNMEIVYNQSKNVSYF